MTDEERNDVRLLERSIRRKCGYPVFRVGSSTIGVTIAVISIGWPLYRFGHLDSPWAIVALIVAAAILGIGGELVGRRIEEAGLHSHPNRLELVEALVSSILSDNKWVVEPQEDWKEMLTLLAKYAHSPKVREASARFVRLGTHPQQAGVAGTCEAAKRLAALGGTEKDLRSVPRRRMS